MYYIQKYVQSDFRKPAKKADYSVWLMTMFDAIDELRRWADSIADDNNVDYGESLEYDENNLEIDINLEDKSIYLVVMYHDDKNDTDYEVPNIEKMLKDHISTVNAMEEY